MLNVIIPVYHSKDTLPKTLDSLVAQTKEMFITTIVNDCDGEDYSDIIDTYKDRGLKIKYYVLPENGGPGKARQYGMDMDDMCDYCMFLDSDDIFMPYTVFGMYKAAKKSNYDVIKSSFYHETADGGLELYEKGGSSITWVHGKIYKLSYLRENDIRFIDSLHFNEDAYFNLVAWNATENRGIIDIPTCVWCHNKNSATRKDGEGEFMRNYGAPYIESQVEGLKKIAKICGKPNAPLTVATLAHIYYQCARQNVWKNDISDQIAIIKTLKNEEWLQEMFTEYETWQIAVELVKGGQEFDNKKIVFFETPFNKWVQEMVLKDKE